MKRFLTVIFIDTRPFLVDQFLATKRCFCAFGDPSGHTSFTFSIYFIFLYYFILRKDVNIYLKYLFILILLFLAFLLGVSRMYESSHFSN